MAKVYALYKTPADPAAFERYYFDRHVPLAKTMAEHISQLRAWADGRARSANVTCRNTTNI